MEKTLKRLADEIANLGECSLADAEQRYYGGTLSERRYMIYCLFWTWGSYKVADPHRWPQDRLLARRGRAALVRRINQFRTATGEKPYEAAAESAPAASFPGTARGLPPSPRSQDHLARAVCDGISPGTDFQDGRAT